jgi:hypothetical protein
MRKSWIRVLLIGCAVGLAGGWATAGQDPSEPTPTPTPAAEADEPPVNTLRWTTASEVDNFGFDIYRGLSEDGPFDRITEEPLPGAGTIDEPQNYVFVDRDIDPTVDYYYYIESISLGGVREVFSPVIRAPAKRPADASDAEE